MPDNLNIAHICPATSVLGPGQRFAVWVQGCPFNCKGCIAPAWIPFIVANVMSVETLAATIVAEPNIQGITISGGEPMIQAGKLAQMLKLVKESRQELDVIVFTGFRLNQLVWDESQALLSCTDLLIDGQYVQRRNDGYGLRGSNNQQFHFLTDRMKLYADEILSKREGVELHLLDDGILMSGIPNNKFKW